MEGLELIGEIEADIKKKQIERFKISIHQAYERVQETKIVLERQEAFLGKLKNTTLEYFSANSNKF